jgi:hypothetical protein
VTTTTTAKAGTTAATSAKTKTGTYAVDVNTIAPKMSANVLSAYNTLGFKATVNTSVSYSGYFDAKARSITLKKEDDTIYHELGHFAAFIAGNADKTADFVAIYNAEKDLFQGLNKAYATQSSSEYFAESVKDYILNPATLQSQRPKTYAAIQESLNKITDAQVAKVKSLYGPIWGI